VAKLYKPSIVEYRLADGSYRTPDGKRVTSKTPGVRRGNCRPCYDRHAQAVRKGRASWAELERQGVVMPAEPRGRKWMAGFDRWLKGGRVHGEG
jgi:hypothetical protein